MNQQPILIRTLEYNVTISNSHVYNIINEEPKCMASLGHGRDGSRLRG